MNFSRVKRNKDNNFTTVSNVAIRDNRLSLKAKGFLLTIMSLPEDWDFSIRGITSIMPEGKAAIYAVIKELIQTGYCVRSRTYENGKISSWVYTFDEQPSAPKLLTENLEIENLEIENLDIDNRPQYKKDLNKDLIKEKKKEKATDKSAVAERIFDHWKTALGHPLAKFDETRRKRIEARLKDKFTEAQLFSAVNGVLHSPYHLGKNDTRTRYDDFKTIFRDIPQVEKFIALEKEKTEKQKQDDEPKYDAASMEIIRQNAEKQRLTDEFYLQQMVNHKQCRQTSNA